MVSYKYCFVPTCTNTNRKNPAKRFFSVPHDKALRQQWCNAMKRRDPLSYKSTLYCCEDHFDIAVDVANLVQYKLVGGKLLLKKGVVPHRFQWQVQTQQEPMTKSTSEPPPPELPSCSASAGARKDDVSHELDGQQQEPTTTSKPEMSSSVTPSLVDEQHLPLEQMDKKSGAYKFCMVPKCKNNTRKSPGKYFFAVPMDEKIRKQWCKVMKRNDATPLSCKTKCHCCEDHFDVESDVSNFLKCKFVGGNMKLKEGVLPHRFECQQLVPKNIKTRSAVEKRRKLAKTASGENLLMETSTSHDHKHAEILPVKFVTRDTENCTEEEPRDPLKFDSLNSSCDYINGSTPNKTTKTKAIKVNMKIKNKEKECHAKKKRTTLNNYTFTNSSKRIALDIPSKYGSDCASQEKSERSLDLFSSLDLSNEINERYVKSIIIKIKVS